MPTAAPSDSPKTCLVDPERLQEGRDIVGHELRRVITGGLVALSRAARIDRDAREVLGVLGDLEGVAGVVRGEVRDEQQGLARALLFVVHRDVANLDLRHGRTS
jgi:hypothetical protein